MGEIGWKPLGYPWICKVNCEGAVELLFEIQNS
jgi:hypothetical protein